MNFVIYKTTNIINGKFYIGKHQCVNIDDKYLGSGKALIIEKVKNILMKQKEKYQNL